MICRNCRQEFFKKRIKRGYIDQCDDCSKDGVQRYVGRRDDKHGDVQIFRKDIINALGHIKRENRIGPKPNLGIGSTVFVEKEFNDPAI